MHLKCVQGEFLRVGGLWLIVGYFPMLQWLLIERRLIEREEGEGRN